MGDLTDDDLLSRWHAERDGGAFALLVRRYVELVYAAATRQLAGDRHLADDVTQAVFLILSQKPAAARRASSLAAWLHQTTRYATANARRIVARRARYERAAADLRPEVVMPSDPSASDELLPLLDDAIASLGEKDRAAIVERYLNGRDVAHVAIQLGTSPDAAQKRIERAAAKLREFFVRRGCTGATSAGVAGVLVTASLPAAAVPQAVRDMSESIGESAASTTAINVSRIAKGSIAMMNWKQTRSTGLAAAALLLLMSAAGLQLADRVEAQTPAPANAGAATPPTTVAVAQPTTVAAAPTTLPSFDVDPAKNIFPAGTFEVMLPSAAAARATAGWQSADVPQGGRLEVRGDATRFARLASAAASAPVSLTQTLPLDAKWKWVTVSARLRAPDVAVTPEKDGPSVVVTMLDGAGDGAKVLRSPVTLQPFLSGSYRDWGRPSGVIAVEPGERAMRIVATTNKGVGAFDIDNVIVVPIDPNDVLDPKKVDAMQLAVRTGDVATVERLVKEDPRLLEARDRSYDGGTPLIITAYEGTDDVAQLLLDLGADRDAIDRNYKAPAVCWAGYFGFPRVVKVMLDAGADPFSKNGTGTTARGCSEFGLNHRKYGRATDDERREAIELLRAAEATWKK